ncbi:MAG: hypothetical protein JRH11_18470 [Deltaproteobacteria bacterium]|nr:hypothetical protein [Deltaproteobacteria bacterium]
MRFLSILTIPALLAAGLLFAGCQTSAVPDAGRADSSVMCGAGLHGCDGMCVPDQVNDPDLGCRLGCGDACPAPSPTASGNAICTSSGRCDVMCTAPYRKVSGRCECVPLTCTQAGAQCGSAVDDGCGGRLACGTCGDGRMCTETNQCACTVDAAEPNDLEIQAFMLGDFPDTPDTEMTFSAYTLDSDTDVDLYRVRVRDTASANPTVRVELRNIPAGSNFELGAWYRCDAGGDATRCDAGTNATDLTLGPAGCLSEETGIMPERVQLQSFCDTDDDSGNVIIQVRSTTWMNACMPYELFVSVT